jgi:serine protease inhibitor
LISPASVYLALAMTMNGAGGTTRDAMLKTLSAKKMSVDKINIACRDWMTLLMKTTDKTNLLISNSIWYNDGFAVDQAFLVANADYYAAALHKIDFADSRAAEVINNWVRQATKNKINSIMDQTDESDLMYLINAVYFKSQWKNQFASLKTYQGDFHLESGTATVSYMNRKSETIFLASDGLQGILLPFADKRYAFAAILPAEGSSVREAVSSMDQATFNRLLESSQTLELDLHLPKFAVESQISLKDSLVSLGMGEAFQDADFSLMDKNRSKDLIITGIGHKAYFKIDEIGAEAAAVTGLAVAASIENGNKLAFDRPFLYGIIDTATSLPLFLGVMDNPAN